MRHSARRPVDREVSPSPDDAGSSEPQQEERPSRAPADGRGEFIRPLTGVRFVAAAWVVLYHYRPYLDKAGILPAPLHDLFSFGAAGVELFWVLSGFVIAHTYLAKLGPRLSVPASLRFLWLRLARVWPVHIATMLGAGALALYDRGDPPIFVLPDGYATPLGVARNVLLMNDWPVWASPTSWNLVSWTVSMELLAYLAFPVLALVIFRMRERLPTPGLVALAVVPILAFVAFCATSRPLFHPHWVFTSELAIDFTTGALLYLLFTRVRGWPRLDTRAVRWLLAFVPPALVVVMCLAVPHLTAQADVGIREEVPYWIRSLLTPVLAFWVLALALQSPGPRGFLSSRVLVLGGFISYSLYMVQFVWPGVWGIATGKFPPQLKDEGLPWVVGLLAGLLLSAFALWRFVEEPARELMRRQVGARPKAIGEEEAEFWRDGHDGSPPPGRR